MVTKTTHLESTESPEPRGSRSDKSNWIRRIDNVAYSIFGDFFNRRKDTTFESIGTSLQQARIPISSDLYLSRIAFVTIICTAVIAVIHLGFAVILGISGVGVTLTSLPAPLDIFGGTVLLLLTSLISIGISLGIGISYPYIRLSLIISDRKRKIDNTIPFATTYLFALTRGGMDFVEALRTLAESDDAYGEAAKETQSVIQDMDYMSIDLPRAMRRGSQRSASTKFSEFMDDLVAVIDSGADMSPFLESKAEEFLEQDEREQENFLETLALLGEVYVTAFVAGPLFLIIITVVMAMLGGSAITQLYGIVYGLLPMMNIAFFILIDTITIDESKRNRTIYTERVNKSIDEVTDEYQEQIENNSRIQNIIKAKEYRESSEYIREPLSWLLDKPFRTLYITAPIAFLYILVAIVIQPYPLSFEGLSSFPVETTVTYLLIPLSISLIPFTIFYEITTRRKKKILNRFPDALKQLASSNSIGLTLTESLRATSDATSGVIGEEFNKVGNDIRWYNNITEALVSFANRIKIAEVARTIKLVTKSNEASGEISEVLDIAAKDVTKRQILRKQRFNEMTMYTVVIIISYAVYLFVIAMLDAAFLSEIAAIKANTAGATSTEAGSSSGFGTNLSSLPIDLFRMVFYHSALLQGLGSGLLAGQLGQNDVRAGIKYAIALMTISTIVFFVI